MGLHVLCIFVFRHETNRSASPSPVHLYEGQGSNRSKLIGSRSNAETEEKNSLVDLIIVAIFESREPLKSNDSWKSV